MVVAIPPAAPILSDISPNPSTTGVISLNWTAVPSATSYKVYRALINITDVTGLTPIAMLTTNSTIDTVSENGQYWYAVVATNASGDSAISNRVSLVVLFPAGALYCINFVPFTLDVGQQVVNLMSTDNSTLLLQLFLNVTSPMQMKIGVTTSNPSLIDLPHGICFYNFTVSSDTYTNMSALFYYYPAPLAAGQENQLHVFNLEANSWADMGGTLYSSSHYIFLNLPHFSIYAVAVPTQGGNNNNQFPTLIVVIVIILVGVAILGVCAITKYKKNGPSSTTSDTQVQLDWSS